MSAINGRSLHYVLKIGNRAKNIQFFREVLGMKVLRHEEFTQGCDAACNGPYDNRWSKTMIGYGPESNHFVIELTYNYGVKEYTLGNEFGGITIKSLEALDRAKSNGFEIVQDNLLISPDGYKFYILKESPTTDEDPVKQVTLHVTNVEKSMKYWGEILQMKLKSKADDRAIYSYQEDKTNLCLIKINEPLDRAKAYGRIAFAVPFDVQPKIDEVIKKNEGTILTPLISLDTPGKATVRVIILADPDGHEICFVDDEGFSELSKVDPESNAALDKYIKKDPFQDK